MTSAGKKELFSTIEQQREKISKYEAKISDLVRAYKNLAKEKEALQASLVALSHTPVAASSSETLKQKDKLQDSGPQNREDASKESKKDARSGEEDEMTSLRSKVATLTLTLHTLTEGKDKLEQSTISERKRILEEKKQVEQEFKIEAENWAKQKKDYEVKLQDMRSKIIVFQHEREKEASNGIMMLREVENRLSKERNGRERVERQLEEAREQGRQLSFAVGVSSQEKQQQRQISDLRNELEQVRCRLKKAEEQCKEPPMLKILQDQMDQMKHQYMEAIHQEQRRAEAAEMSVRKLSQAHEERVAALESNLTELSHTAAMDDRRKRDDIHTIHSLKEKIAELSAENAALNSRRKSVPAPLSEGEDGHDVNTLLKSFISLWNHLSTLKHTKTGKHFNVEELLSNSDVIHRKCVEEYNKLEKKNEDLKIKFEKENEGKSCRCGLKEVTEELRGRIRSLNASAQMTHKMHQHQVEALTEDLKSSRASHDSELRLLQGEHRATTAALEQQLAAHCQRSLLTLQDRDEEIHRLSKDIYQLNKDAQAQPSTVAAALLSHVGTGGTDGPLLHHLEDLARKELEVSQLRREKIAVEKAMREIEMARVEKQQAMTDTIQDLSEEVERLKRNTSRKGENLEYLKNVVLQYMTSPDGESRQLILNAIAAVLKFTPAETESVRQCLALWWWQQAPAKTRTHQGHHHRFARRSLSGSGGDIGGDVALGRGRGRERAMSQLE